MKKIIYKLPEDKLEIFAVELNGYGFEVERKGNGEVEIILYAEDEESESLKEAVEEILNDLKVGKFVKEEYIKEENWEEKWKENIKPVIIDPFLIYPEWEIYKGDRYIPIKIKIGMAFGTGLHPTTQLILKLLPKYIKKGYSVLDIGTGTGILAIASAKLGADKIVAIDIDKQAVEECKTNSWENEVNIECKKGTPSDIKEKFDIVLANLETKIFRDVFKDIIPLFSKYLILSGIFKEKERDEIKKYIKENNLVLVEELSQPEAEDKKDELWYAFVVKRNK